MTQPHDGVENGDLLDLAVPYALHALPDAERDELESRLAHAPLHEADAFYDEVRAVRETMALVSSGSAAEPPADLRQRLLSQVAGDNVRTLPTARQESGPRRRTALLTAAAAAVIGLGAVGVGVSLWPKPAQPSTAQQVFAAPDVHTISGDIPGGGTATVVFSRDKNAGVLVMNNVPQAQARHGVPDVVGQRQGRDLGRNDGRQGRGAVDHGGAARSGQLQGAEVHRRTGQRFHPADRPGGRRVAAHLTVGQARRTVAAAASATTSEISPRRRHA